MHLKFLHKGKKNRKYIFLYVLSRILYIIIMFWTLLFLCGFLTSILDGDQPYMFDGQTTFCFLITVTLLFIYVSARYTFNMVLKDIKDGFYKSLHKDDKPMENVDEKSK